MHIELLIMAFITLMYIAFIGIALLGFLKLKNPPKHSSADKEMPYVSIVVSARNEESHIGLFISQIADQHFPKTQFEILFVDDASEDKTLEEAKKHLTKSGLTYTLIEQKQQQGKKKNLMQAIAQAKGNVIITTDADVISRPNTWLETIARYFKNYQPDMLIMPVDFISEQGWLTSFQIFENIAITGITAGYTSIKMPFMCNGANLAFKKKSYELVDGYKSHQHLSSGEDIFLLESIKKNRTNSIFYLFSEEGIIKTVPQKNTISLIHQRIRWASKAQHNRNWINIVGGFFTVLSNFLIIGLLIAIFKKSDIVPYLSIFVFIKLIFDFLLLFLASNFLKRIYYLRLFIPIALMYWLYALIIGISSFFYKPYWKGKKIN